MIQGNVGTIASKIEALAGAGAQVFTRIRDLVDEVAADIGKARGEKPCS
jgi:PDZ domain-containing secreted protein